MKYLLVLLVVVVVAWMLLRRREQPPPATPAAPPKPAQPAQPNSSVAQDMLACAHCGLHLPKTEAQFDAAGRPFCSEGHRLNGPRAGG